MADWGVWLAWATETDAGVFIVAANQVQARRSSVFDPVLHVADLSFGEAHVPDSDRLTVDRERAHHSCADGHGDHDGRRLLNATFDLALEHVRSRQQFGVAIVLIPGRPAIKPPGYARGD